MKSPFFRAWFGDWRSYDTKPIQVANRSGDTRGVQKNQDTGWTINVSGKVFQETSSHNASINRNALPYLSYINDIVQKAVLLDSYSIGNRKSINSLLMHSFYAVADIGNGPEILKLYVEEMNDLNTVDSSKRAYQLQNIEKASTASVRVQGKTLSSVTNTANAVQTVADLFASVKSRDKNFHPKAVDPALLNGDGSPKVFYHGTPNGDFTVFRSWQYFTDSKAYADVYQNQGASSNGYKATARNRKTYETYLAPKMIFDTRNPVDRKVFQEEFYGKWGNGTPLSEKGLPDWTDGDDLVEFFEENGYEYDAVLLDEGATGGYGEEVKSRGISIAVRDATAVKSATDNVGTFDRSNPDIRYSLREQAVPTREELEKKPPIRIVDISTPQTKGSFAERRKQILAMAADTIKKPYLNKDTDTMIFLTEKSYTHIFSNAGELQINAAEHLPEFVENAVLTHSEAPRYGDPNTDGVYTFFAAAKTDGILPVKLKVKEYLYHGQDLPKNIRDYFAGIPENFASSYDTVVLEVEEIEKSPIGSAMHTNRNGSAHSPTELSTIKVADLLGLVKGNAAKYIPVATDGGLRDGRDLRQHSHRHGVACPDPAAGAGVVHHHRTGFHSGERSKNGRTGAGVAAEAAESQPAGRGRAGRHPRSRAGTRGRKGSDLSSE